MTTSQRDYLQRAPPRVSAQVGGHACKMPKELERSRRRLLGSMQRCIRVRLQHPSRMARSRLGVTGSRRLWRSGCLSRLFPYRVEDWLSQCVENEWYLVIYNKKSRRDTKDDSDVRLQPIGDATRSCLPATVSGLGVG